MTDAELSWRIAGFGSARQETMNDGIFRLQPAEYSKIQTVLSSVAEACASKAIYLISPTGQEIASQGEVSGLDSEAICSLAAGALAATYGLAALVGETAFHRVHHRGRENSVLICPVGNRGLVLLVLENTERDAEASRVLAHSLLVLQDLLDKCSRGSGESDRRQVSSGR